MEILKQKKYNNGILDYSQKIDNHNINYICKLFKINSNKITSVPAKLNIYIFAFVKFTNYGKSQRVRRRKIGNGFKYA